MHFTKVVIAITATLSTSVNASMTGPDIVSNINQITSLSTDLQTLANSINVFSGPLSLIGQGPFPQIIAGLDQIVTTVTGENQAIGTTNETFSPLDEQSIPDAFTTLVQVYQELLNTLIEKAGILSGIPLVGTLVPQLTSLEDVVDNLASGVIDLIPDVAPSFATQQKSLDDTIQKVINAYNPAS